jgi:2-polyprenyl-3-methyl-5-hydroxy-6-metoxy-1,4-benzoquinol methylase
MHSSNLLVNLLGFTATLIHGDTLTLDRWLWLKRRLPATKNGERLLDVGCGSGAFSIGASRLGYTPTGLSWDGPNQRLAERRATICKDTKSTFDIVDVRELGSHEKYKNKFEVAVCCENIEHIIDDQKLISDIAACLRPGGRLLLTTPYQLNRAITPDDNGPYKTVEDGGHVRRGYSEQMLTELSHRAGLKVEKIGYVSGLASQKTTAIFRRVSKASPLLAWLIVLPLRPLIPPLDRLIHLFTTYPYFCIALEAYKPRT